MRVISHVLEVKSTQPDVMHTATTDEIVNEMMRQHMVSPTVTRQVLQRLSLNRQIYETSPDNWRPGVPWPENRAPQTARLQISGTWPENPAPFLALAITIMEEHARAAETGNREPISTGEITYQMSLHGVGSLTAAQVIQRLNRAGQIYETSPEHWRIL